MTFLDKLFWRYVEFQTLRYASSLSYFRAIDKVFKNLKHLLFRGMISKNDDHKRCQKLLTKRLRQLIQVILFGLKPRLLSVFRRRFATRCGCSSNVCFIGYTLLMGVLTPTFRFKFMNGIWKSENLHCRGCVFFTNIKDNLFYLHCLDTQVI